MARGRAKLEWDQSSLLWALHANVNRDVKEHPKPYLSADVHPYRTEDEYKPEPKKRKKRIGPIKLNGRFTRLNNGNFIGDSGRESIS